MRPVFEKTPRIQQMLRVECSLQPLHQKVGRFRFTKHPNVPLPFILTVEHDEISTVLPSERPQRVDNFGGFFNGDGLIGKRSDHNPIPGMRLNGDAQLRRTFCKLHGIGRQQIGLKSERIVGNTLKFGQRGSELNRIFVVKDFDFIRFERDKLPLERLDLPVDIAAGPFDADCQNR